MTVEKISKKTYSLLLVLLLLLCTASCNTVDPPPDKTVLTLTLEDVSCTEAWITLTTNNLQLPATLNLLKDNTITKTINLQTADTLLYIDSLLPNQTYKFQTSGIGNPASGIRSNEISITTMDTTSHDFTFETRTFGTIGSSSLYDVAIINEQNIWCVGEILIADTSENGYTMYNAVHWDGSEWTLHRIMFYTFCGQQHQNAYPANAIFAFNENEIFITSGSQITHINGTTQIKTECIPVSVNKLWGTDKNNLYAVGVLGQIARYNGTSWKKIESGTDLNINDIWGDYNEKTGEWEILAVASNKFFNEGNELLYIDQFISRKLNVEGLPWSLSTVWLKSGKNYYVAGDGLYFTKIINDSWIKDSVFIPIYKDRIRGQDINDIIVCGSNGLLSHFNGFNWRHYINNELPFFSGRLLSCDLQDNLIIAVGRKNTQSIITIGKR